MNRKTVKATALIMAFALIVQTASIDIYAQEETITEYLAEECAEDLTDIVIPEAGFQDIELILRPDDVPDAESDPYNDEGVRGMVPAIMINGDAADWGEGQTGIRRGYFTGVMPAIE